LGRLTLEIFSGHPKDIVRNIVENDMYIEGLPKEESMIKHLYRYIPTAAALGGVMIGLLTVFADMIGAIGSGTGILIAVTTIYSYYEKYTDKKR
jgi:protein transport protein SEC61 subunit alpha